MQVADEHGVDVPRTFGRGDLPLEVQDPVGQHRVGEQAHAADLDQHGRVPEPRHPACMRFRHPTAPETRGMTIGPLQVLVINFDEANFSGEIEAEMTRLEEAGTLRVHDILVVAKSQEGAIEVVRSRREIAASLRGEEASNGDLSPDEWAVADAVEPGGAAAIAILEHRWAVPLKEAIERAGGHHVVTEWANEEDLANMGVSLTS